MKILLCNDDGIESNGIRVLANALAKNHEVLVIAPNTNRSAISHSLTIRKKIQINKENLDGCKAYSISGTPADCVKVARLLFKDFIPDVVVAGINKAHNIGSDIMYSGTVAICYEASFFGHVGFAFSAHSLGESNFELYSKYVEEIINKFLPLSEKGDIWNVNFPDESLGDIKGIKITPLGRQLYSDFYEKIGENEYVLDGELVKHSQNPADCDVEWTNKGYITVTPLLFNRTDYKKIGYVTEKCKEL